MTVVAERDRLGAAGVWFAPASGEVGGSLAALLMCDPGARSGGLDREGIDAAWGVTRERSLVDASRTCLRAVRVVPPGCNLVRDAQHLAIAKGERRGQVEAPPATAREPSQPSRIADELVEAARRVLAPVRRPIVALGGGLDAPLAVLAARRAGILVERAVHLAIPGTSYDESVAARESAAALGLDLHEVHVTPAELAAALPRAVRLAGTPLYNLHPVARVFLAAAARELGGDGLVTGDGADQACRGAVEPADYVPIVAAITRGFDLAVASPFVDTAMIDLLVDLHAPAAPAKQALRALAKLWGLPASIADRPKTPCWAPPLPRGTFPVAASLVSLSRVLGRPLVWSPDDDAANVGVASLSAFVHAFEITLETSALQGKR